MGIINKISTHNKRIRSVSMSVVNGKTKVYRVAGSKEMHNVVARSEAVSGQVKTNRVASFTMSRWRDKEEHSRIVS